MVIKRNIPENVAKLSQSRVDDCSMTSTRMDILQEVMERVCARTTNAKLAD
jgi:hypothetical protein